MSDAPSTVTVDRADLDAAWGVVVAYASRMRDDEQRATVDALAERLREALTAASWMQSFKPDWDVFAGNPLVACQCGWTWDATEGASTLADAVEACAEHAANCHHAESASGTTETPTT